MSQSINQSISQRCGD